MKSVKIALICPTFPPFSCGVGKHTSFLLQYLAKLDTHISFITSGNIDVQLDRIPKSVEVNTTISTWGTSSLFKLLSILKRQNPDIVHLEYPTKINGNKINIIFLPLLVKLFLRKPFVITQHEFMDASVKGKIRNCLLLLAADYVIFPNEIDKKLMSRFVPFLKHRSEIIPIGPTIPVFSSISSVKKNKYIVSFIGYLDPSKGFETLLHALALLHDPDIILQLLTHIEEENPYHKKVLNLIDQLGLRTNIILADSLSDEEISHGLSKSDIVVLPYVHGVTLKRSTILDAFSHAIPVISTKGAYTPDVFTDANIVLVAPYDEKELAIQLTYLKNNPEKIDQLKQGMKIFIKNFAWDTIANRTFHVYMKMIEHV